MCDRIIYINCYYLKRKFKIVKYFLQFSTEIYKSSVYF